MTYDSAAQPSFKFVRALAAWALPWLCSTTLHALLLLVLALTYGWVADRGANSGSSLLAGLEASFTAGQSPEDAAALNAVEFESTDSSRYYEDEVQPAIREAPRAHQGGGAGDASAVSALLNEKPALELAGVLPASGAGLGSGGLAGTDVGSGQGLTAEPQGSNRLRGGPRGLRCSAPLLKATSSSTCSIARVAWTATAALRSPRPRPN